MAIVIILISAYIAAQMIADVTSLKIAIVMGMSIDAGTFIYPFTFTLRDMVHKRLGIQTARLLIIAAAGVNLLMAAMFWFTAQLTPDLEVGPQIEYAAVLAPVWRIVIASILAEVLAELVDTEVYRLWVKRVTIRHQWARVLISNAVSVPLDSAVFCAVAFYGDLPDSVVWSIFITNILIKGLVTLASLPGIYLVKER